MKLLTVLTVVLGLVQTASAQLNDFVVAPGSTVEGKSISEWTVDWWTWAWTEYMDNVIEDPTGDLQHLNQSGPIYHIAGTFGGTETREFTVPHDKHLLIPLVNTGWGEDWNGITGVVDLVAGDIDLASSVFFSLNGESLEEATILANHREPTGLTTISIPFDNHVFLEEVVDHPFASDGYWVMLEPLPVGEHALHFGGSLDLENHPTDPLPNFMTEVTANITVVPEPGALGLLAVAGIGQLRLRRRR